MVEMISQAPDVADTPMGTLLVSQLFVITMNIVHEDSCLLVMYPISFAKNVKRPISVEKPVGSQFNLFSNSFLFLPNLWLVESTVNEHP